MNNSAESMLECGFFASQGNSQRKMHQQIILIRQNLSDC